MKSRHLIVVLSAAFCLTGSAATLPEKLLFYAPMEDGSEPLIHEGSAQAEPQESTAGVVGKAVRIRNKPLSYHAAANIAPRQGTVAFWIAPSWSGQEKPVAPRTLFSAGHLAVNDIPGPQKLFFMTGQTLPQKGFKWDYSAAWGGIRSWQTGQWHHLAFTWDAVRQSKSIYVDGRKIGTYTTQLFPDRIGHATPILFGRNAPADFDEIMIWGRELSPEEITLLATRPAQAAAQLRPSPDTATAVKDPSRAAALANEASFYVSCDASLIPDRASGSRIVTPIKGAEYPAGMVNQCVVLAGTPVRFDSRDNVNPAAGTVMFWLKPGKGFGQGTQSVLFRAGHLAIQYNPAQKKLFFMTGRFKQERFLWDYGCATATPSRWSPDEWHHIAVTWERATGKKNIYLDGKPVAGNNSQLFPETLSPVGEFMVGTNVHGHLDEFYVWPRPLTGWEIAEMCANPNLAAAGLGIKVRQAVTTLPCQKTAREQVIAATRAEPLTWTIKIMNPISTVIAPGETYTATLPANNASLRVFDGEIVFTLRDLDLNDCGSTRLKLKLLPGQKQEIRLPFKVTRRGIFKVEAVYSLDGKKCLRDLASFACWPQPQSPNPDSFFGNHVNAWNNGKFIDQAARLGQNWMRDHNMLQTTWWSRVQPNPGPFTWTYDFQLDFLKKYRMPVLGQLFTTPYWAAAAGPQKKSNGYNECWRPDLKKLDRYVYETVKNYANYIKYWEIWNEPAVSMFWKGTPEEFAATVQAAVKAARRADPTAKLMSAGYTCSAWVWHRKAAAAGAFKGLDILSIHYGTPLDAPEQSLVKLQAILEHFQGLAVKYGDGKRLPVWSTEGGCGDSTFFRGLDFPQLPPPDKRSPLNYRLGAIRIVQGEALLMSQGVEKHFIYFQNPVSTGSSGILSNTHMLDFNNAPRPKLMARVAMQEQLDYTQFAAMVRKPGQRFWAAVFQRTNAPGSVVLLWCGDGGRMKLSCPWPATPSQAVDLMGNAFAFNPASLEVTDTPIYLHVPAPANQVATALKQAKLTVITPPETITEETATDQPKVPSLPDFVCPGEDPANVFTIDLRPFCNMGLADEIPGDGKGGWADEGELNDMRNLKTGRRKFYDVTFDLIDPAANRNKAVITLKSTNLTPKMPGEITGIPVNRKARVLYFLHAAAWGSPGDIGQYVIHYADGSSETVNINIPQNCNNWWNGFDDKEVSRPVPVKVTNTNTGEPAWRYLRVFEWENPKMKTPIRSIDIKSNCGFQTPIVLAISGVGSL